MGAGCDSRGPDNRNTLLTTFLEVIRGDMNYYNYLIIN